MATEVTEVITSVERRRPLVVGGEDAARCGDGSAWRGGDRDCARSGRRREPAVSLAATVRRSERETPAFFPLRVAANVREPDSGDNADCDIRHHRRRRL